MLSKIIFKILILSSTLYFNKKIKKFFYVLSWIPIQIKPQKLVSIRLFLYLYSRNKQHNYLTKILKTVAWEGIHSPMTNFSRNQRIVHFVLYLISNRLFPTYDQINTGEFSCYLCIPYYLPPYILSLSSFHCSKDSSLCSTILFCNFFLIQFFIAVAIYPFSFCPVYLRFFIPYRIDGIFIT